MIWYNRISMQRKILVIFLLFALSISAVFSLFIAQAARKEHAYYSELLMQANHLIDSKLTTVVEDLRFTSAMYLVNPDIVGYVENNFYSGKSQYVEALRALRANTLAVKVNPNLSSVTYLTLSGQVFSSAGYNEDYLTHIRNIAQKMDENKIKYDVTPVYKTTINQQSTSTVTYSFLLRNPYNLKLAGYGFINLDAKRLAQNFHVLAVSNTPTALAIQDNKITFGGEDLAHAAQLAMEQAISAQQASIREAETMLTVRTNDESYLCATTWNQALSMIIVNYAPLSMVNALVYSGISIYIFSMLLMIFVFAGASVALTTMMTKPLRILQAGMKQVEHGKLLPITQQTDRQDDMGELIRGFNRMVVELKDSILREYESRDLQRKAQIKMLESQINPHFLYNTLNLISSIALVENVPLVGDIATNLADLFRYSVSGGSTVSLREELEQANRYISIQKLCMAGELIVDFQIDPAAYDQQILKFLLQPLVENSVIHGFGRRGRGGRIAISAELSEDHLIITVSDDGTGIMPGRLAELRRRCENAHVLYEQEQNSIGMLNVNFRLKAFYGKTYGLQINSELGTGSSLVLHIPLHIDNQEVF